MDIPVLENAESVVKVVSMYLAGRSALGSYHAGTRVQPSVKKSVHHAKRNVPIHASTDGAVINARIVVSLVPIDVNGDADIASALEYVVQDAIERGATNHATRS